MVFLFLESYRVFTLLTSCPATALDLFIYVQLEKTHYANIELHSGRNNSPQVSTQGSFLCIH